MPFWHQSTINMCATDWSCSGTQKFSKKFRFSQECLCMFFLLISILPQAHGYNCYKTKDYTVNPQTLAQYPEVEEEPSRSRRSTEARSSVVFDGDSSLILNGIQVDLKEEFTLALKIYLEGGQPPNAEILVLENVCYGYYSWSLLVNQANYMNPVSKLSFALEDVYSQQSRVSVSNYRIHNWYHITLVNSHNHLRLYLDGTRIQTAKSMDWSEFTNADCLRLRLGGHRDGFRGKIQQISITTQSLDALEVKKEELGLLQPSGTWLSETFTDLSSWYSDVKLPYVQPVYIQHESYVARAPSCGKTVCDDPRVVMSYASSYQLMNEKNIHIEIVYTANSDGSNPTLQSEELRQQTNFMMQAFRPWNITFTFTSRVVKNTTLNTALVLIDCQPNMMGRGSYGAECSFGDFNSYVLCYNDSIGDGRCDLHCNNADKRWDGGDCCSEDPNSNLYCADPSSPHRRFYHTSELTQLLNLRKGVINIVIVNWKNDQMYGIAALPWEYNNVDISHSTVIVSEHVFKSADSIDTVVHELGHTFGLWHVHRGFQEVPCSDQCVERQASLVLGDLCSDTPPSAIHGSCSDPDPSMETCGIQEALINTPFDNFMSYSNGECSASKVFTRQQAARMHCYLDLVHNNKIKQKKPSAIPLPIQIVYSDQTSVTLSWIPPFNTGSERSICSKCKQSGKLTQYAVSVHMNGKEKFNVSENQMYAPKQATGPPDAKLCEETGENWIPKEYYKKLDYISSRPDYVKVFLFVFEREVNAHMIRLFIPWYSKSMQVNLEEPVDNIRLVDSDGHLVKTIDKVHIQCDKPFTKIFTEEQLYVKQIAIITNTVNLAFDAVELISKPESPDCNECTDLSYRVTRVPPYTDGTPYKTTTESRFEDTDVTPDSTYKYTITPVNFDNKGQSSAEFTYIHTNTYCGNGYLDDQEDCDDGNQKDDDGCSSQCLTESGYLCEAVPSYCWKVDDLVEKPCALQFTNNKTKCGFYVPPEFTDQWASSAEARGRDAGKKQTHLLLGPPPIRSDCPVKPDLNMWTPYYYEESLGYTVKFGFEEPVSPVAVIVHIASSPVKSSWLYASIIFDIQSQRIPTPLDPIKVTCADSPFILPFTQDLTLPFHHVKEVVIMLDDRSVSIGAVRLRTFKKFDPITLNECESGIYNTDTRSCTTESELQSVCPDYQISNGYVTCTGNLTGDKCFVTCEIGYQTSRISQTSVCYNGRWSPQITCELVICDKPAELFGYNVCEEGHHYNSICEIACFSPNYLLGNGTLRKCLDSGVWTIPRAYCVPVCDDVSTIHAVPLDDRCVGTQPDGTSCQIECQPGYHLRGPDKKRRQAVLRCLINEGVWENECIRTTCDTPPAHLLPLMSCDHDDYGSGSVCVINCPTTQLTQTVSCNTNGEWNDTFDDFNCDYERSTCPQLQHDQLQFECTGYQTGSRCRVACADNSKSVYITDAQEKTTRWFDKLKCGLEGTWSPLLDKLSCHQPCHEWKTGDGWCDMDQNRELCSYDGGDCCESSTITGSVQCYPESDADRCSCLDPDVEN